jgi:class 3 adenylate cyclase
MEAVLAAIGVVAAAAAVGIAYRRGLRARHRREEARRLDEYPFYPFVVDANGHVAFDAEAFDEGVRHLLKDRNDRAARELIVIGQQNLVRDTFPSDRLRRYKQLYAMYGGDAVVSENDTFLENFRRIVQHIGRSFPNTGIEILLHNLVNPSRSLVAIENAVVTGRSIGSGATNLVLDLKTRRQRGEDKINYELNIGSRRFKCTTIPIFRPEYGLVGAICINIDARFIRESVMSDTARLEAFFDNLLRTDFELDENILSQDEYRRALEGKRNVLDEAIHTAPSGRKEHRLAAILFSDIVGFTSLMEKDESATLEIIAANTALHQQAFGRHRGRLLRVLGDGILASFDSASDAVACARSVQQSVAADGRFQVRIGVHLGDVVHGDGDVHGDGVNIASRIQAEVGPGEIGISDVVYANVRNKQGLQATSMGERSLKNVSAPVVLYSVKP